MILSRGKASENRQDNQHGRRYKGIGLELMKGSRGGSKRGLMTGSRGRIDEGIGERIDERIGDGIEGRVDERIEERIGKGIEGRVDERIAGKIDERIEGGNQREETSDGSVRCICACNVEKGEMVCCDICEGWTHLKCIGMKEGVGGMEGEEYVCHFCVSACLLALRREVEGLRKELKEVREENVRMKGFVEQERLEGVRAAHVKVKENVPRCERLAATGDRVTETMATGKSQQQTGSHGRQKNEVELSKDLEGSARGGWKEVKRSTKGVPGVRKVWGTRKKVSCNDVAREMIRVVGKVESQFSVVKHVDELKGKNRWWFIVKAPEKSLQSLDKEWQHEHWYWQKVHAGVSGFLGMGPVSIRHR